MDRLRNLSDRMWSGFCLSSDSGKQIKDEESTTTDITGGSAGSGLQELANDSKSRREDLQAKDDNRSSEDENDNAFSLASKLTIQGQGNSTLEQTRSQ